MCLRLSNLDDLAVQLEAIHLLDSLERRVFAVENDESLALAFQATLGNDVQYRAIVLEDFGESLLQCVDLHALLEVVNLGLSASRRAVQCECVLRAAVDLHKFYNLRLARRDLPFRLYKLTFRWALGTCWDRQDLRPGLRPPSCPPY